jgi:hypothetical protein
MNLRFTRGLLIIPYLADTFYILRKITHVRKYTTCTSNFIEDKLHVTGIYMFEKDAK